MPVVDSRPATPPRAPVTRVPLRPGSVLDEDVKFGLFTDEPVRRRPFAPAVAVGPVATDLVALPAERDVPCSRTGGARGIVDVDVPHALTEVDVAAGRIFTGRARHVTPEVAVDHDR
ncbi:MAG TPA: hypothetical protein VG674_08860 [Amycolatopsis sp.]|nr:hypothetical protein [Amycolatopsis sp.]